MTSRILRSYGWLGVFLCLWVSAFGCPGTISDPARFFRDGSPIVSDGAPADNGTTDTPPADLTPPADTPADTPPSADDPGPADTPPVERTPPKGCDPIPIFEKKCNFCHGADSPSAGLSLVGADLFTVLTNKASQCAGSKVIDTKDVLQSVFWLKVSSDTQCKGGRMPPTGTNLPAADLDCIKNWLTANAGQ